MAQFYGRDLAFIHASAFETLAEAAASALDEEPGLSSGARVLDLGCGAGPLSAALAARGLATWGADISPDLIRLARARLPAAEFVCGSVLDLALPEAAAVAAIGEVLNYATADRLDDLMGVFRKVHAALEPGGVFLFDLAAPGRGGSGRAFSEGKGWAVGVQSEEQARGLVRHITTFRLATDGLWRRSSEKHRLRLWPAEEVLNLLGACGFEASTSNCYGELALPSGLCAYRAVKPARPI